MHAAASKNLKFETDSDFNSNEAGGVQTTTHGYNSNGDVVGAAAGRKTNLHHPLVGFRLIPILLPATDGVSLMMFLQPMDGEA